MRNKIIMAMGLVTAMIIALSAYYIVNQIKAAKLAEMLAHIPPVREIIAPAIIDATNDVTRIPSQQTGIIKEIVVSIGQKVSKGQLLFTIDSLLAERNVLINKRYVIDAENNLLQPEQDLKHVQNQLARIKSIDPRAISQVEIREKAHEVHIRAIQLEQAKQRLTLARVNLKNAKLNLSQYKIFAPTDGIILQINGHVNEFVGNGQGIILLGDAKKIIVRISIDERDINISDPEHNVYLTSATYTGTNIPLTFIQRDRFIIVQDRLNARVQEALYYFNRDDYPKFIAGQLVDVHVPTIYVS